jgi:hypothetical protein
MLIGVTGRAGAGKDTVCDHVVLSRGYVKYSLAGPLKKMLSALGLDCDDRATKDIPHWMFGKSPRQMMQTLGTEWMRDSVCEDGWLKMAQAARNKCDDMIISDVRFQNEADWVRQNGGYLIHLYRPDAGSVAPHSSERGVRFRAGRDLGVINNNSVEILNKIVSDFIDAKS